MALVTGCEFRVKNAVLKALTSAVPIGEPLHWDGPCLGLAWTDVPSEKCGSIRIHYFQTRGVHIHLERVGKKLWRLKTEVRRPFPALHTWAREYPTWRALFESIEGVEFFDARDLLDDGKSLSA